MNVDRLKSWVGMVGAAMLMLFACVMVLRYSWRHAGPIATVVYAFLFLFALTFFPVLIGLLGGSLPGASKVGKLHIILGQFAYGRGVLLQLEDRFEWVPATSDEFYFDGEWHEINGGETNWSVVGWRPFGIIRYKEGETFESVRVDTTAGGPQRPDGGTVKRGGFEEATPPAETGLDGKWVLDLKRMYSHGLKKIGDIEVIEKAEEIATRRNAEDSITSGWEPIIGSVVGLIIGLATGYVMLGGV